MKKIRMKLTNKQINILKKWMGTIRYVYNLTIDRIRNYKDKIKFETLRNKIVTKKNNNIAKEWSFDTPKEIRAYGVKECVNNFKTNFKKKKGFTMKYKSRKNIQQTITLPKQSASLENDHYINIYKKFNLGKMKITEKIERIDHDFKITFIRPNIWYLVVPISVTIKSQKEGPKNICALDPGLRTFMVGVDINGKCFKIGENSYEKIKKRSQLIDR